MKLAILSALVVVAVVGCWAHSGEEDKTHIIYILADDLGWNDVSWHNPSMLTPRLQKLAEEGVILENLYVHAVCSPTRSSLMTGKYASNIGSQHFVFTADRAHGLPLGLKTLPEKLKEQGYSTYVIGKWHLGFCSEDYLPSSRGFDKFFGFYTGGTDYYEHNSSEWGPYRPGLYNGYDLHQIENGVIENLDGPAYDGIYTSYLFRDKIRDYIDDHDKTKPMFFYLSLQLPHSPVDVPSEWADLYPGVADLTRRNYSGQVSLMDTMVGELVDRLELRGMLDDSLIIFHSDNGGDVRTFANNWPLRGSKGTYFEAGIRGAGFINGKGIKKTGYVNEEVYHITDMFPTLVEGVAGGSLDEKLDGLNIWHSLSRGDKSPRNEVLITVDGDIPGMSNCSAIRYNEWKLIVGFPTFFFMQRARGWYPEPSNGFTEQPAPEPESTEVYLFNLQNDPYERFNVASQHPDTVAKLTKKLDKYRETAWTFFPAPDAACNPDNFGGFWSPGWC